MCQDGDDNDDNNDDLTLMSSLGSSLIRIDSGRPAGVALLSFTIFSGPDEKGGDTPPGGSGTGSPPVFPTSVSWLSASCSLPSISESPTSVKDRTGHLPPLLASHLSCGTTVQPPPALTQDRGSFRTRGGGCQPSG